MTTPETPLSISFFSGLDAPDESELYKCVHCGFCLQACPTYVETGLEAESPRGRIALMKAVNEGRIEMTESVVSHWDLCIQCRACEIACPSGVPYGRLIEARHWYADEGFSSDKAAEIAMASRAAVHGLGGSMIVERCPVEAKAKLDVWDEVGEPLATMRRMKEQYDPKNTLNPGRFVGGI